MINWKETCLELPSNNQNGGGGVFFNNYVYKGCFAQQSSAYIYKETSVFMLGAYYEAFTHSIRNSEGAIIFPIKPNTSQWVINWAELPADTLLVEDLHIGFYYILYFSLNKSCDSK